MLSPASNLHIAKIHKQLVGLNTTLNNKVYILRSDLA